jgi:hypothetical protein
LGGSIGGQFHAPCVGGDFHGGGPEGQQHGPEGGDRQIAIRIGQSQPDNRDANPQLRQHDPAAPQPPEAGEAGAEKRSSSGAQANLNVGSRDPTEKADDRQIDAVPGQSQKQHRGKEIERQPRRKAQHGEKRHQAPVMRDLRNNGIGH